MLSAVLPTGCGIGLCYGRVKPGDGVAVVGAGPVGLAAMMTASLYGAARLIALDIDANRLDQAHAVGIPPPLQHAAHERLEHPAGDTRPPHAPCHQRDRVR